MNVPEARPDLLTDDVRKAVERYLPLVHQWLNGGGPGGYALRLPMVTPPYGLTRTITLDMVRYWAPAPWAGRVYSYVWPAAEIFGQIVAHGEPYRVYDDYATFLASVGKP